MSDSTMRGDSITAFHDDFLRDCRTADPLPRDDAFLARDAAQTKYAARIAERAKSQPYGADLVIDAAGWLKEHPEAAVGDVVRVGEAEFMAAIGRAGVLVLLPSFFNMTDEQLREKLPAPPAEGPRSEPLMGEGPIGPILATRPMLWRGADGVDRPAMVEIGKPYEHPKPPGQREGAWCCRVRTTGLGDDRYQTLFGGDSLEALGRALVQAGALVSASPFAAFSNWALEPRCGFPIIATMEEVARRDEEAEAFAADGSPRLPERPEENAEEELRRRDMDPRRDGMYGDGPVGPLAATRELLWRRPDGKETPVLVEIGVPTEIRAKAYRQDWGCRQRVTEMGGGMYFTMPGGDGVEALILALDSAALMTRLRGGASGTDWSRLPNNGFVMRPAYPKEWWAASAAFEKASNKPTS